MTLDDPFGGLLDKEQLLGGPPTRRAATLLFLIETRTTRLVALDRHRLERTGTEESAEERALAFVEAFAVAREIAVQPSVQDLERQAAKWANLVPSNPRLQAALALRLSEKYRFTGRVAPGIRKALGVDTAEVREAFQALYGEPIETVFATRLASKERLLWAWTGLAKRLESLPPFWAAYALTLTETVGASILALPIALASLGPLPGLAILAVLGLVNVFTVSLMAESVVRTGPMRYPGAFLGRLVESNLGRPGSLPVSTVLGISSFLGVSAFYVGFGTTLDGATSVPAAVWVGALFLLSAYYVRRGSLDATVATAIAVGAVNLCVVLMLAAFAFAHLHPANLTHAEIPFVHGRALESSAVGVVFGVVLMAYFGHLSAVTCGSLVLERDPGGRSLVTGCASAQATAFVVYCVFVLATTGAVGAQNLIGVNGTVITPLADVAGAGVAILGSVYVILGLGMGSLFDALALSWLVRERLPSNAPRVVVLPKGRARLVFRSRGDRLRVGLAYLGQAAGGARFSLEVERRGVLEQKTLVVAGRHEVLSPDDGRDRLMLEVLESDDRAARIATSSTLRIAYEGELGGAGLDLAGTLTLSDVEAALTASLLRSGEASVALAADRVGRSEQETLAILEALATRGIVEERPSPEGPRFFARMAPRRARSSSVWETIVEDGERPVPPAKSPGHDEVTARGPRIVLGHSGRFLVSLVPLTAAFALAEWFLISGVGSFAGVLSFLGVIVVSLLAGLYPILLLVASRRKGEYALEGSRRLIGRPVLLVSIYLLFLAVPVAHAAVIWDAPAERIGALAAAVAMVVIPAVLLRSRSFGPRLTIEVRDDQRSGTACFAFLAGERPVDGAVRLRYADSEQCPDALDGPIPEFDSLERAVFEVRAGEAARWDEVKVWAHRVTPEGESESLPATALVRAGDRIDATDLTLAHGETVVPFADAELEVDIVLRGSAAHRT